MGRPVRAVSPAVVNRAISPTLASRHVPANPARRTTSSSVAVDAEVWETVRTFEPVMSATMKKLSDLAEMVKILQEQCSQQQSAHELAQADLLALKKDYTELKGEHERKSVQVEELKAQVERLEARQAPADLSRGYSDELDEAVAKVERNGCESETVQRQWKAQMVASPPPLPQDLGRTPPCSPREAADAKTTIGQENGPANVEVKKRIAGSMRSHHKHQMQPVPCVSSIWLQQNFGGISR
jgi:hypothetical protein